MATNSPAYSLQSRRIHYLIDRDILLLPEVIIEDYDDEIEKSLNYPLILYGMRVDIQNLISKVVFKDLTFIQRIV